MIELINNRQVEDPQTSRIFDLLDPLVGGAKNSASLLYKPLAPFDLNGAQYQIPRFIFLGPRGGAEPIRIGIFAAIHGDESATASAAAKFLELLDQAPELARDFCLFVYPIC